MHFGTKSKECVTEGVTLEMFQIPLPVPYILMPLQFRQESLAPLQYHTPQRQHQQQWHLWRSVRAKL